MSRDRLCYILISKFDKKFPKKDIKFSVRETKNERKG